MQNTYSMVIYNGQLFEKFSMTETETGKVHYCYIIDDKEFSEEERTRQQKLAIARDMVFVRKNASQPLLLRVKS